MAERSIARISTGVEGLDEILQGGVIPGRAYLVRGGPGSGKTTLGLHFLTAGAASEDEVLFITLGEPEARIRQNANLVGFDVEQVGFLDLSPSTDFFTDVETYDIFSPAEVEREPTTRHIIDTISELKPNRVFIDSMTQFRYLTADAFQYRKQVLSFLRYLTGEGTTVLFTSEGSAEAPDADLQFLSDGIIDLRLEGTERHVCVSKFRGSQFQSGTHAVRLTERGMRVFPKLVPDVHRRAFTAAQLSSGVPALDEMLNGGLERGTVTIVSGPSGVGKTTLGLQFMKEAAGRGARSVVYTFEEEVGVMTHRAEAVNMPVRAMVERGALALVKVEPLQFTPDEFAHAVYEEVEQNDTRVVMIDSIAGFRLSLGGGDLISHLHALCKYLQNVGVAVILITETQAVIDAFRVTEAGFSYLADNTVFLRYLEIDGEMRKAIGVLKKRMSDFQKTLREYSITRYGIRVGDPLTNLRGILSGQPEWIDI